jgi:hypothetical protein
MIGANRYGMAGDRRPSGTMQLAGAVTGKRGHQYLGVEV